MHKGGKCVIGQPHRLLPAGQPVTVSGQPRKVDGQRAGGNIPAQGRKAVDVTDNDPVLMLQPLQFIPSDADNDNLAPAVIFQLPYAIVLIRYFTATEFTAVFIEQDSLSPRALLLRSVALDIHLFSIWKYNSTIFWDELDDAENIVTEWVQNLGL